MTDHRLMGEVESQVVEEGSHEARQGSFMVIRAITELTITSFVSRFPREGAAPVASFILPAGAELLSVKSLSIDAGTAQIFWM